MKHEKSYFTPIMLIRKPHKAILGKQSHKCQGSTLR